LHNSIPQSEHRVAAVFKQQLPNVVAPHFAAMLRFMQLVQTRRSVSEFADVSRLKSKQH
jgi:hypothetical protein